MPLSASIQDVATLQQIIDAIPNPVIIKNGERRWVIWNEAASEFMGRPKEALLGKTDFDLFSEEHARHFWNEDGKVLATGVDSRVEEPITDGKGNLRWLITSKRRIEVSGEPMVVAVVTDITSLREAEAHSRYLSLHDPLTGLPNRALFADRVDQALARLLRRPASHVLLCLDLDRFKEVNDSLGHQAGDELLREFGCRIAALLRPSDTLARLGGDEFAILLSELSPEFDINAFCCRIVGAAASPFLVGGQPVYVGTSIGVMRFSDAALGRGELLRRADIALYQAKHEGRGRYSTFHSALDEGRRHRVQLEAELREALASGQGLELRYQPFVGNSGGKIVGVEALVRWHHPRLGLLGPVQFLGVAEESGLIGDLEDWVLTTACAALDRWPGLRLAVNMSQMRMRDSRIAVRIAEILGRQNFKPQRLELEITEAAFLAADETMLERLSELRQLGVRISLDNFGTGYSTLERIRTLEIDKIKIDRSFIHQLERSQDSGAMVRAIVHIGHAMRVEVTAEGVETLEQRDFLQGVGCSELQGYYFFRPTREEGLPEALSGPAMACSQAEQRASEPQRAASIADPDEAREVEITGSLAKK